MEVKAPNGDVYDLPDATATGLSANEGWSLVAEKPAATRRGSSKAEKQN